MRPRGYLAWLAGFAAGLIAIMALGDRAATGEWPVVAWTVGCFAGAALNEAWLRRRAWRDGTERRAAGRNP